MLSRKKYIKITQNWEQQLHIFLKKKKVFCKSPDSSQALCFIKKQNYYCSPQDFCLKYSFIEKKTQRSFWESTEIDLGFFSFLPSFLFAEDRKENLGMALVWKPEPKFAEGISGQIHLLPSHSKRWMSSYRSTIPNWKLVLSE